MLNENWVLSVGELNEYVRRSLAADPLTQGIKLKGEISNFKRHSSGHWYFSLKDEKSRINCVMFRQSNLSVKIVPSDGMQVVLSGSVSLFVRDGAYQFYADSMRSDGLGDLYLRFEQLKLKLQSEGLFDAGRKRPLPLLPNKIGILTSKTGAVLHDICRIAGRRFPNIPMVLYPVLVQGEGAAKEIAKGLEILGNYPGISVIILGRGGGSLEDLWPFNEEIVARAIYDCNVPVVSAVGHETDFVISDFVADMRAATPSMAAEIIVPLRSELELELKRLKRALGNGLSAGIRAKQELLLNLKNRLLHAAPQYQIEKINMERAALRARMDMALINALHEKESYLAMTGAKLQALAPYEVLKRGYAITMQNNALVASKKEVNPDEMLEVVYHDGTIQTSVTLASDK